MTRILGVDFSGASDAGRKIWIAEGRWNNTGAFALASCIPAIDLPLGGAAPAEAIPALVRHIAGLGEARIDGAVDLRHDRALLERLMPLPGALLMVPGSWFDPPRR